LNRTRTYLTLILLLLCVMVKAEAAPSTPFLNLQSGQSVIHPIPYIRYLEDYEGNLTPTDILVESELERIKGNQVSFGASDSYFWLYLPVRNTGNSSGHWQLVFKVRFMEPLDVYWVDDSGTVSQLLHNSAAQPFSDRTIQHRNLVTPIHLDASESGAVLVRYASRSSTRLPIEILTSDAMHQEAYENGVISAFFVGAVLMLVLVNLFQYFALSRTAYLYYSLQAVTMVIYIMQMEGYNFMYLWPDSPVWNSRASVSLGLFFILSPVLFIRSFLETKEKAVVLHQIANVFLVVVSILFLVSLVNESLFIKRVGFYMGLIMLTLLLTSGLWYVIRLRHIPARYYLAGWLAAAVGGALFALDQLQLIKGLPVAGIQFLKLGALIEAVMLSAALADQVRRIKDDRDAHQLQLMDMMHSRLKEAEQFAEMEKEKNDAILWAQEQSDQLSSATHDLRSPLYALKMALRSRKDSLNNDEIKSFFEKNMSYMQALLHDIGSRSREDSPTPMARRHLSTILEGVIERHTGSAAEKNLELRYVPSSISVQASPVLLERILDNLITNAIKYTQRGRILVGLRRKKWGAELQVHDTGYGMTEEELADALKPYRQGEPSSSGYGLGLSIVQSLCMDLGFDFRINSTPDRGTVMGISIDA